MPTLTVILAPDGPAAGVPDVLADLSAGGLVAPFAWVVDADVAPNARSRDIDATLVDTGRRSPTTIGSLLADTPHDRRRLCVVVPVTDPAAVVSSEVEQRVSALLAFTGATVPLTLVRAVVTRPGDCAAPEVLARDGWHNVLVAPEDARGPGLPATLLPSTADPVELGRHAAPAVAGLVGLWAGVDRTPLDDDPPHSGVRAGRAFYRGIDAGAVEQELRGRVLATRPRLPEPGDATGRAVHLDDTALACRNMAAKWWAKHRDALVGPRTKPEREEPVDIGWLALLRMFLRFLWAALRNAPHDLLQGLVVRGAARVARRVHTVVLGVGDASYRVVVHGVTGDGKPLSWGDVGAAAGRLDDHLAAQGYRAQGAGRHEQRPDLRQLWDDYAAGALTLADAGRRGLEPERHGATLGVVRSTDDIVAPPDDDFTDIPGHFRAEVGQHVATGDVLGAEVLRRRLEFLGRDPVQALDAGATLQALDGWEARHRHSYSVQVGGFLAEHLTRVVGEIRGYLDRLREAAAADGGPEPGLGRGTVWLTRILGVLALAGLVAGPVLGIRQLVPVRVAILIGVLPLVVWLAVAIGCYVRERREIFRDLHGLRTVRSEVEAAEANLRQATLDARRLADAYAQYLVWSRVVGAVLAAPFGPPARAADPGVTITHGLPRTTQVARARVDERATAHAAAVLRSDVFVVGWLGRLWREHLQSAGARLSVPLAEHPDALVDLRSGVEGSPLVQWADVLAREGTSRDVGDRAWGRVMDLLRGSRHDLAAGLLSSVQALGHDGGTVDLDRFLAGVDRPEARGQEFDAEHFTANARAAERSCVEIHEPVPEHRGLSRTDVLVQLTQVWRPWDFAVTEQATDDVEPAHVPIPHGAHTVDGPVDRVPVPRAPEGYR